MATTSLGLARARRTSNGRVLTKRQRARRSPSAVELLHRRAERALALKRYLCLLVETRVIIHMQLELRAETAPQTLRTIEGGFHRIGLFAHAVDSRTALLAADLRLGLAFTDLASTAGLLSSRLAAHNLAIFGSRRFRACLKDAGALRRLNSLLAVIAYVDFAKPRAFANAGFDVARICSNPRYR